MWLTPIIVTTAMFGRIIFVSVSICPRSLIPISKTAASSSFVIRDNVSGTPIWLF